MTALPNSLSYTASHVHVKSRFAAAPNSAISAEPTAGWPIWRSLINELRSWRDNGEQIFDVADKPAADVIATAIGFAEETFTRLAGLLRKR